MIIQAKDVSLKAVLGYLGYRGQNIPPELLTKVKGAIQLGVDAAKPRFVGKSFPLLFQKEKKEIQLEGGILTLQGASSWSHLVGADFGVFFAVTLGGEMDALLKKTQITDLTLSFILEGVATQMVEVAADKAEALLKAPWAKEGLYTNHRFSPGYGDVPLGYQPDFIRLLDAQRAIGLTVTPQLILLPRKSVTAFFGVFPKEKKAVVSSPCVICALENCSHRKEEPQ